MKTEQHTFGNAVSRVALISDTHGHIDPGILALIHNCDIAIHAGDVLGCWVLEQMQPRLQTIAVAGNNDACATALPDNALIKLPSGTIAVEHGHRFGQSQPNHGALLAEYRNARAIVYGHTHKQLIDQGQVPWILNPGAAGRVRNQGGPWCLVLTINDGDWRVQAHCFKDLEKKVSV